MLCAVAVMHVEIDDCDAPCAVRRLRMARAAMAVSLKKQKPVGSRVSA